MQSVVPEVKQNWMLWINLAVWGYVVQPLYRTRYLWEDEMGNVYSGGSCWADLSIHLHMAYSFIFGRNSDVSFYGLMSPIFAGEKMSYPFLPDWHAAVLFQLGSSMRHAMMNPGIAMFFSFVGLMFFLSKRLVRSSLAATVCIALVILAGGMGGFSLMKKISFERIMSWYDPIQDLADQKNGVFWFAFLPHIFLPQRGATFAYPMVLTILLIMWNAVGPTPLAVSEGVESVVKKMHVDDSLKSRLLMVAAVLSASLPLVQLHSFVALAIIITSLFLMELPSWVGHPFQLFSWLSAGVTTIVLSAPQLNTFIKTALYGGADGAGTFMSFRPIWSHTMTMTPTFLNYWKFWWNSLGPAVPLFTVALIWWSVPAFQILLDFIWSRRQLPRSDEVIGTNRRKFLESSDDSEEIYQYGGTRKVSQEDDRVLRKVIEWCSEEYEPLQKLALEFEYTIQCRNPGRVLDAFKFALCGGIVWFISNVVIFQPWDRDNCKILYVALFLMSPFSAKLLTFSFEHVLNFLNGSYESLKRAQHKRDDGDTNGKNTKTEEISVQASEVGVPTLGCLRKRTWAVVMAAVCLVVVPVLLYYSAYSGGLSLVREYHLFHVMYDKDAVDVGEYMRTKLPPKGVTLHDDTHLSPAGFYAGRQVLVSYTGMYLHNLVILSKKCNEADIVIIFAGWVSSHGYDYHERHRDRETIMQNILKDSDRNTYSLLRKWGVRYVLAENPRSHPPSSTIRKVRENLFLDRKVKRLHTAGRYQLFEVTGYGFPPQ